MKKYIMMLFIMLLSGCSLCSSSLSRASDGAYYYVDWCKYDNCYPSEGGLECYKNDEFIAKLYPLSMEEVQMIMQYEQMLAQQALNNLQLSNQMLQNTNQNLYQTNMMMQQRHYENMRMINEGTQRLRDWNNSMYNNMNNYLPNSNTINTRCIKTGNIVNCQSR